MKVIYLVFLGEMAFSEFSYNDQTDGAFLYSDDDNATELIFRAEQSILLSESELPVGSQKHTVKRKVALVFELSAEQFSAIANGKSATKFGNIRLLLTDCTTTRDIATFAVWFTFNLENINK